MADHPEPDLDLAERLFATLAEKTKDVAGVTRPSYGEGEQFAHNLVAASAREAGLEASTDAAGNLYLKLRGREPDGRTFLIGSHLDSVPKGGNFDGAAGVLAGLSVLTAWSRAGYRPRGDVAVMVIRAEESTWFPYSYIGSKAALGQLPAEALDIPRADTGSSLAEHMAALGFDPEAVRAGRPQIGPDELRAFVELHIEQGPVLLAPGAPPVALVTGIRGSFRYREARVLGAYGHSGAVPRSFRQDAVVAAADFVLRLDDEWVRLEAAGHDLTVTIGKLFTDPEHHAFSKIAGEVGVCIDVRSHRQTTLAVMRKAVQRHAAAVEAARPARIELGPLTGSEPAVMDDGLIETFGGAMEGLGMPRFSMASGAGHDAAVFAAAGVPTAMLFIRNENGSHNPHEAMAMTDFAQAARVLARGLAAVA